jgi:rhomboid protease GluP
MISQLIIGFMLESLLGPLRVAGIYFVSGIGGNLFSALCYPTKFGSVGASTAIFGLIATLVRILHTSCLQLAVVFVNWKALDRSPEIRCCLIAMVCFVLFFSIIMSFSSDNIVTGFASVDVYGHLGGLIAGFFIATYLMVHFRGAEANRRGSYEGKCKLIGLGGSVFFFILNFTLFFTVLNKYIHC